MNWWTQFYDDQYADMVLVGEDEETQTIMDALIELLEVNEPMRWFDQCCGVGRWSFALANRGHHIDGVDLMDSYIKRANDGAQHRDISHLCHFERGDALEYVPDTPCDIAMNWYTSFGYFEDDASNLAMIQRAHDALKPGGRFVLEVGNAARIVHTFLPCMTYRQAVDDKERLIVRESSLALVSGMMQQKWTFIEPDGRSATHDTSIKLYQPHELIRMITAAGFESVETYGGVDGSPLTLNSTRCLLIARKPDTTGSHHQ